MVKRCFDFLSSLIGLIVFSPVLVVVALLVFIQDFKNPLYIASRVGKNNVPFRMVKMRSMVSGADKSGLASTSATDMRVTPIGHFIRRFKIDEITQLWNVLIGDMSLVGPRPQVQQDVDLYTVEEMRLLSVRPGITDFSSIVFADEGEILAPYADADLAYQQRIRPWKSRLGILYIQCNRMRIDVRLILLTVLNSLSRERALIGVSDLAQRCGASEQLVEVCKRKEELLPHNPPGASSVYGRVS